MPAPTIGQPDVVVTKIDTAPNFSPTPIVGLWAKRGMVFQSYTLFSWPHVRDNIMLGPRREGISTTYASRITDEVVGQVGLKGFEISFPREHSEGMCQRVALPGRWPTTARSCRWTTHSARSTAGRAS